ncbi:MAG: UvrD-helicase domain-containing protein, partial [Candidatus Zixiibacteriota bacterium]
MTEEQRDIVESIGQQPLLVLAGPGTGKTEVLSHGILQLLSNKLATKEEIIGITFTTKAAQQMKKRLCELGLEFNSQPLLCTLHSLSMRMLKDKGNEIGITEDFIIADEYESYLILYDAIYDINPNAITKTKEFSNRILLLKCENKELSDISDGLFKKVFIRYQAILRFHSALDFQDLVIQACRLLGSSEEAKNFYQTKAKYLLVDEFQDINKAEYCLINHLAGTGKGLSVVGDDKQSIYSWRGGNPKIILGFANNFPQAIEKPMTICFRCPDKIIKGADEFIKP